MPRRARGARLFIFGPVHRGPFLRDGGTGTGDPNPQGGGGPAPVPTPPPAPPAPPAPTPTPPAPAPVDPQVEALRREAANYRTQRNALAERLGLTPEQVATFLTQQTPPAPAPAPQPTPTPADPAPAPTPDPQLAEQLATANRRLAVLTHATAAGGNPTAMLDSAAATTALAAVDLSNAQAVTDALKAVVTANPHLRASQAPARVGVDLPGGGGTQPRPATLAAGVAARYGTSG